ncbi:hypothetical protein [Acidithiobacillus sp.]|uniref:hypothetical protein n=1 Tax=Acidithiobacillus sp. TaxID=1872118 RepID=UPI00261188EC|nr:hypothetical protein [Acidithiobacillus sp.]MDD2748774.1 hypothetical protein [Acidithiobacillus sp.]MDD5280549.1 hypothetical protein [Acidithiobacillus sp.]
MRNLSVDYGLIVAMLTVAGLAACGVVTRGGIISDAMMSIALVFYGPALMRKIIEWLRPKSTMFDAWGWDNPRSLAIKETVRRIRRTHRQTFGRGADLYQRGAIGHDLTRAKQTMSQQRGGSGRQHGGGPAAKQAAGTKSADDDGGPDGEPPRYPILFPILFPKLPQSYTYRTLSERIPCAEKTLRNMVSLGRFPRPIQTLFGPRFSQEHLALALSEKSPQQPQQTDSTHPKRGRPPLALGKKGGAA